MYLVLLCEQTVAHVPRQNNVDSPKREAQCERPTPLNVTGGDDVYLVNSLPRGQALAWQGKDMGKTGHWSGAVHARAGHGQAGCMERAQNVL